METILNFLTLISPVVVGMATVPVFNMAKRASRFVDKAPAWSKQIAVAGVAVGLTQLGGLAQVVLPETLHAISVDNVSSLLSAAIAYAIHAGRKATS